LKPAIFLNKKIGSVGHYKLETKKNYKYELQIIDGHPIFNSGKQIILLDTGSPVTLTNDQNLLFENRTFDVQRSMGGANIAHVSDLLGFPIHVLLGSNIISQFHVCVDYKNGSVTFSDDPINEERNFVALGKTMGLPVVNAKVDTHDLKFYLDTGARLSYLHSDFTLMHKTGRIEEDFYPGLGKFETPVFSMNTEVSNEIFETKFGHLPKNLETMFLSGDIKGILGFDFFNNYGVELEKGLGRIIIL
jgi:hypothetical protein